MARSTARFISYDLRPAKQSERGILVDLLKVGGDCGLPIRSYRYVGMGANRFYDFLLLHKYLGIADMVSLEHDPSMFKRAQFNAPFSFIEVKNQSTTQFIAEDACSKPTIFWLDYDGGIGPHILRDISSLAVKIKVGDFIFVTTFGGPPNSLDREKDEARLIWLQDNLGDVAGGVTIEDVERANFATAVHKVLYSTFRNGFATRDDGLFAPLMQITYSDSKPMITLGGVFLGQENIDIYCEKINVGLPFLETTGPELYNIKSLNITDRERTLFDRVVTNKRKRSKERTTLESLGFKEPEIAAYRDLLRYFPRYVETIV